MFCLGYSQIKIAAKLLSARGDAFGAGASVEMTQLSRIMDRVCQICQGGKAKGASLAAEQTDAGIYLTAHDDVAAVTKVAEQLGYYDAAYFCRSFKKETGLTPAQYAKKKRSSL